MFLNKGGMIMDFPDALYILFPKADQWVLLEDWDYSHVKIYEVDWERKRFRAHFLMPPKYDISELNYPYVDEKKWIPFEKIKTTLRKFWGLATINLLEEELSKQLKK